MKRFITVLSSLLVLPAFAEVAPVYYDEPIEYTDDVINDEDVVQEEEKSGSTTKPNVVQRATANRTSAVSRAKTSTNAATRANTSSRAVASSRGGATAARTTAARTTASRTAKTNKVVNRSRTGAASRATVISRNTQSAKPVTARVGTAQNSVMPGNRTANTSSTSTLTDSGKSLYNPTNGYSRVGVGNRRSTARLSATIAAPSTVVTQEEVTATADNLNALTELTDYCKAQYAACMDNYCNVLDDNQGRCSCSKNLKNYAKTEATLAQATEEFQEVVQKIRYIGLTGQQVESLFAETEAELSMKSNSDSSRLKSSLDAIKKKIVDVSSPNAASTSATNGLSWDLSGLLDADFTAGFDLGSFLGVTSTNTSSVSNQRGEQLYKTATNRCKTNVLNSCVAQGIDANVITNSYDLEIDKQCVAYERSLNEANQEMRNNVFNASNILQQARLMLAQNRNSYDLRGCVAAIDACMQDEYVCGSDYEQCLDPTGKYLANGEVVKGGTPGVSGGQTRIASSNTNDSINPIPSTEQFEEWVSGGMFNLYSTWDYTNNDLGGIGNAWSAGPKENLGDYIDYHLGQWKSNYTKYKDSTKTTDMATYLLQKIGYIDSDDKVHGMCASAMKQCQDYTFDTNKNNKKYIPDNEVVRQYLNSTLAKIKVKQDTIIADYAEGCRADVQSCLSTNGYDETAPDTTASKTAVNACAAEITTCMSVGGYQVSDGVKLTLRAMTDWVASMLVNCPTNHYLADNGVGTYNVSSQEITRVSCMPCQRMQVFALVDGVYESTYSYTANSATSAGGQVTRCTCPSGFSDYVENGNLMGCIRTTATTDDMVQPEQTQTPVEEPDDDN
ncbi:MAG: hypothetical protein IKP35_02570 [Alphaproteobacteria bacterium]|nr:hypothetical protein [Alphaproteobacteria bacterium]